MDDSDEYVKKVKDYDAPSYTHVDNALFNHNTDKQEKTPSYVVHERSKVAIFAYVVAVFIYLVGFILGITDVSSASGTTGLLGDFAKNIAGFSMLTRWYNAFVSGSLFLIIGKVIDLLDEIKSKH